MSLSIKRGLAGAVLTALAAGAIALTAVAPASASTVDTGIVKTPVVDGVNYTITASGAQGPSSSCPGGTGAGWAGWYGRTGGGVVTYTFDSPVHSMVITEFASNLRNDTDLMSTPEFHVGTNSASASFTGAPNSRPVNASTIGFGSTEAVTATQQSHPITITDTSGTGFTTVTFTQQYNHTGICLSGVASLVPQADADCTAGLTGSVSNVNQPARSAVLSGTGKAGETITVTTPNGPVTTVVPASGNWTTTVANLANGNNALTVNSSDNCAPVALSVMIDPLQVPIMHPAAAAGAAVLGLGALGFGGLLRRRNTARI